MTVVKVALVSAFSIALAATGMFTACSNTGNTGTLGPTSVVPVGTVLEIVGPDIVPLGASVQLSLIAHLPNGSQRDVTTEARWSEFVNALMSFSAPGLLTGRERGDTQVFVEFDRYQKRKDLMVLPAGTYRLTGNVSEAGFSDNRVSGARVEVTAGVETPLAVLTDGTGMYRLYGVSGLTEVRVTKDGYQPTARSVDVTSNQTHNFELPLSKPHTNLAGTFTLTITAANHCGVGFGEGNLPETARVRSYTATIDQFGPILTVRLSASPDEYVHAFEGSLQPGRATFTLRGGDENTPIIEQLPNANVLEIDGNALAEVSPTRVAGALTGVFRVYERAYGIASIARCSSTSHSFVLSR